jgi:hypothetical protein
VEARRPSQTGLRWAICIVGGTLLLAILSAEGLLAQDKGVAGAGNIVPKAPSGPSIRLRAGTFIPTQGESLDLPPDATISGYPKSRAGYYIVQFQGPIQAKWKADLADLGAVTLDYIPDFAFVVYMDEPTRVKVGQLDSVAWIGIYQPAYKLSPDLAKASGKVDVVVLTFPTEPLSAVTSQAELLTAQIQDAAVNDLGGLLHLEMDATDIVALAHTPAVSWIEPFYERTLSNDVARSPSIMAAETAWSSLGLYGQGQVVAVADTGLDTGDLGTIHQDFQGNPTGCSGTGRIVATYALGRPSNWSDSCRYYSGSEWINAGGHGTHVIGSVLGNGCQSGSSGLPDYSSSHAGLAPQASLVFQSIMDAGCNLGGIPSDLNTLFAQAQAAGAQIHTNSWGAAVAGQYTTDARNTDLYTWNHKDFTILFAAANEGVDSNSDGRVDLDSMGAPATAKNCITVGATENNRLYGGVNPEHAGDPWDEVQCTGNGGGAGWGNCWPPDFPADPILTDRLSDNDMGMAAFSSRGPTDDGRIKPDVVAPGANVLSTKSQGQYVSSGWGSGENPYYQFMGGTSMATPLTAGATALVRQFYTDIEGFIPSSALIKATLINSAVDIYPGQYTSPAEQWPDRLPNDVQGWGRVKVSSATDSSHVYEDITDGHGVNTGESDSYVIPVCTADTLKVTLVWTDYPGSTAASSQLVNDLDLSVTAPNGTTTYLGNVFSNGWSTIGGSADRVNNVESVYLQSPSAGDWTVSVSGHNIAQGTRPGYALVMDAANNTCTPDFTITATPSSQDTCIGDDTNFDVDVGSIAGFADLVDLSTDGQPGGATVSFSVDPVPPPGSSVLTVGNTEAASAGTYNIDVVGTSGTLAHQDTVTLNLQDPISIAPVLTAPADGSTQQPTTPTFTWDVVAQALGYDIEIATDPGMNNVVDSAAGLSSSSYNAAAPLSSDTVYYWHVRATNSCGPGSYSPVSAFRTEPLVMYNACRNPGVAIPDGSGSISDEMSVLDSGPIVDLDVYLNVDHTWVGDLDFTVQDLDTGTSVMIVDRPGFPASTYGCSGDNMDVTLDDEGISPAESFCSNMPALYGHLTPNNPLSSFDGVELAGSWRITVADHVSQDSGTLNRWCLVATVSLDVPADYSDLPGSYGVAWHTGDGMLRLGTNWHADTSFGEGDDNGDDDGITLDPNSDWQPGASVTIYADVTGSSGYLAGWFDWNEDGDMADAQEQAIARNVSVGSNTVVFPVPTGAGYTANRPVNARFRLYTAEPTGLLRTEMPVGEASGGEVEDYRLDPAIPTAIELARFEAISEGVHIRLQWETVTELDVLGFDLYRADSPDGSLTRINGQQIPAQMPGSPVGATYVYIDRMTVPGSADYYYWLRAVNTYGAATAYGPISVTAFPALRYAVYLPVVSR